MASPHEVHFPLLQEHSQPKLTVSKVGGFSRMCSIAQRYFPILHWLPAYPWKESSAKDLAGGATLGCILVAQSLAHADLCKVNLINGPYSCILPPVIYSLMGTCVHSSVGTGGLISLLTGDKLAAYGDLEQRTHAGAIFTLLVGAMIALMGIFQLSFLVRFLSRPALSGFITASALLIIISQFKPMLGLPKSTVGGIQDILLHDPAALEDINWPTLVLSVISFLYLYYAKKLKKIHPGLKFLGDFKELVILGLSAAFCMKESARMNIEVVGNVPSGLPSVFWPVQSQADVDLAKEMMPSAFLVALVTFLSSFAGAKKFAMQAGYQVVAMNELLALGFANIGGAFCGAVPTQIGLSRMGIAYAAGVRSQLGANVYVAIIVAAVVQLFSMYLYFVPRCVLNAIIANGASHLMEWDQMSWLWSLCRGARSDIGRRMYNTGRRMYNTDFAVWWVACLCTLYYGAFAGILVAVLTSLLLIVYQAADPPIITLGYVEERDRWLNLAVHQDARERSGLAVFRIEGPMFYANIEALQEWLADLEVTKYDEGNPLKAVIMSAAAVPFVDTTAIQALKQLIDGYHQRNIAFLIANASGQPSRIFATVLGELLPAVTLDVGYTVQECFKYIKLDENRKSGQLDFTAASDRSTEMRQKAKSRHDLLEGEPVPLVRMSEVYSAEELHFMPCEGTGSVKVARTKTGRLSTAEVRFA